MACTWGSKVNGILTVVAIGLAVLIDLWGILDHKKEGHTMVRMCSSRILFHQLNILKGLLSETFHCTGDWSHRCSFHDLPLVLLCSLRCPHPLWSW